MTDCNTLVLLLPSFLPNKEHGQVLMNNSSPAIHIIRYNIIFVLSVPAPPVK